MKKIPLTKGKYALVDDDDDFLEISKHKWLFNSGYAMRGIRDGKKTKLILMHRIINKTPDNMDTDHINGNKLDNRKLNLRTVTPRLNAYGRFPMSNKSSIYKGVHYKNNVGRWYTSITKDGKRYFLGGHDNEIDAAKAYDKKAKELFGEHAYYNFPHHAALEAIQSK